MKQLIPAMIACSCMACVADGGDQDIPIFDEPKTLTAEVTADAPLWLRVPAGEVRVEQGPPGQLSAELMVLCSSREGQCARAMDELELITETNQDGVHLALNRNGAFGYRNAQVNVRIAVPPGHPMHLDVTAGDVKVDASNCTEINMEAGDLNLAVPAQIVRSVTIDTGVGDASLRLAGKNIGGRRAFLVGAEVYWDQGAGDCDILVDLQAGDARVDLG